MLVSCKSPSDKVVDDFKKLDSSLQIINASVAVGDTLLRLNLSILAQLQSNPALARKADSVYMATALTTALIDSVKEIISVQDTTGENTYISSQVMASGNCGIHLYNKLFNAYMLCHKYAASPLAQAKVDSLNTTLNDCSSYALFEEKLIKATPSAGTITILSKLKTDCIASAIVILQDIKNHMAKIQ